METFICESQHFPSQPLWVCYGEDISASSKVRKPRLSSASWAQHFAYANVRKTLFKATQPIFIKFSTDIYEAEECQKVSESRSDCPLPICQCNAQVIIWGALPKTNLFWRHWPMSDEGFLYSIHLNGWDALCSDVPACPLIYSAAWQDGSPCKTFCFYANQPNNARPMNRIKE